MRIDERRKPGRLARVVKDKAGASGADVPEVDQVLEVVGVPNVNAVVGPRFIGIEINGREPRRRQTSPDFRWNSIGWTSTNVSVPRISLTIFS